MNRIGENVVRIGSDCDDTASLKEFENDAVDHNKDPNDHVDHNNKDLMSDGTANRQSEIPDGQYCLSCRFQFKCRRTFLRHHRDKHMDEQLSFQCACGRTFNYKFSMMRHERESCPLRIPTGPPSSAIRCSSSTQKLKELQQEFARLATDHSKLKDRFTDLQTTNERLQNENLLLRDQLKSLKTSAEPPYTNETHSPPRNLPTVPDSTSESFILNETIEILPTQYPH